MIKKRKKKQEEKPKRKADTPPRSRSPGTPPNITLPVPTQNRFNLPLIKRARIDRVFD
jgi:hypothetical protein